ncbi:hypothetical protein ACJJID_19415 [Microbulbifer sp. CnH-101-G]|uniref:hypothetical protein n=1 Tax=Microbulbifer sp. CnH-101-G TaxID=3243393 RepID=UPI004039959A
MKAFKLLSNHRDFLAFKLPMKDVILRLGKKIPAKSLMHFYKHNLSLKDNWEDLNADFIAADGVNVTSEIPDVTTWVNGTLVFSDKAKEAISEHICSLGEFLPVSTPAGNFWIFNCQNQVSAEEMGSHNTEQNDQVLDLEKISFRKEDIGKNLIFKTQYDGYRSLYCSSDFCKILDDLGIKGIRFSSELSEVF